MYRLSFDAQSETRDDYARKQSRRTLDLFSRFDFSFWESAVAWPRFKNHEQSVLCSCTPAAVGPWVGNQTCASERFSAEGPPRKPSTRYRFVVFLVHLCPMKPINRLKRDARYRYWPTRFRGVGAPQSVASCNVPQNNAVRYYRKRRGDANLLSIYE